MKLAIIGSRTLSIENIQDYLPPDVSEIVSGGARGIDQCAREYAKKEGIKFTEFQPNYRRYGRGAPLKRNDEILRYADEIYAFWDGISVGTKYMIEKCRREKKKITVFLLQS